MGTNWHEPKQFLDDACQYKDETCLFWPFSRGSRDGRARVYFPCGNDTLGRLKFKEYAVHRIVCEKVYGAPPSSKHHAAHSCGNGHLGCINPKHLRWATSKENEQDKIIHGTSARGERNYNARLTKADVLEIRSFSDIQSRYILAKRFNVTVDHIRHLQARRRL